MNPTREQAVFLITLVLGTWLGFGWYPIFPGPEPVEDIPPEAAPTRLTDDQLGITPSPLRSLSETGSGRSPFAPIDIWVAPHPEPLPDLPALTPGRVLPGGETGGIRSPNLVRHPEGRP